MLVTTFKRAFAIVQTAVEQIETQLFSELDGSD